MIPATDIAYDLNRALKNTMAIVLAGGRGSRLMDLTENEAKPAVPFGGRFRLIDFPLSNCVNSGIRKIAVPTQYKAHTLIQHIQWAWGSFRPDLHEFVELWPAQQQTKEMTWYRGTADAIYQNLASVKRWEPDYILVLQGDHAYRQDYSRLLAWHIERGADATITCLEVERQHAHQFGCVLTDDVDNITAFIEKPSDPPCVPGKPDKTFINMGVYVFNAEFLYRKLEECNIKPGTAHDFGKDILPSMPGHDKLVAHRFNQSCVSRPGAPEAYWRDVGTVDAYWAANIDLTSVTPSLDLYDSDWPIWTWQAQAPGAKFVFDEDTRRGMAVDSVVSGGCVISGATIRRSLLSTNVRVHSFCQVEDSVILPDCVISRNCRLKKVVVDTGTRLPEGLVVGEDAGADARRFHHTPGGVTLITQAMIEAL